MDMANAVALAGVAVSGGSVLTAAILRYVPSSKNGTNGAAPTDALCEERRDTINSRITAVEGTISISLDNLSERFGELREDIGEVFAQIEKINERAIKKAGH